MEKFKGTIGPWILDNRWKFMVYCDNSLGGAVADCEVKFSVSLTRRQRLANALLISKSPEMLKMIDQLCEELEFHQVSLSMAKKGRELIKEATSL